MSILQHVCKCNMCMPVPVEVREGQKRTSDPLRLELQMIVNHLVDARNRTWIFFKNK